MNKVDVKIKLLAEGFMPEYKHETDACADCHANVENDIVIGTGAKASIPLGFKLQLPKGWKAVINPRSGIARKNGVVAVHGEIDEGYLGEVGCTLINHSDEDFIVRKGDRICQIGFEPYYQARFEVVDTLVETDRGEAGFGSTGV